MAEEPCRLETATSFRSNAAAATQPPKGAPMLPVHAHGLFAWALVVVACLPAGALAYGPLIKITANGERFLQQGLRDSEVVSVEQLGNYLARLAFKSTAML